MVASMIGAGVYTTSGYAIGDLGSPWVVMAAWLVGGMIALAGAASYAQLAQRITENGGEYLYLSRLVHPIAGVITGWVSLFAGFTGAGAFAAVTFEAYAMDESMRPTWLPPGAISSGLVAVMTVAHATRARRGIVGQNGLVVIKLALIAAFVAIAFWRVDRWAASPFSVPLEWSGVDAWSFMTTVMWISLSYSGFNAAIYVAGDARNGGRDLRFSMIGGTVLVTLVYGLLNVIFVFAPAASEITYQENVASIAAQAIGGDTLDRCVRVVICIGLATSVSSLLVTGPRVYAKMADDGCLPSWFKTDGASPTGGILFQGIAMGVVSAVAGLSSLLSYLGLTLSLSAAATVATLFIPNKANDERQAAPGLSWGAKVIAAFFVLATVCVAAMAGWNQPIQALAALVTLVIGVLAYCWRRRAPR